MSTKTPQAKKTDEQKEAKRQQTQIPHSNATVAEGSHSIDHLTTADNHEMDDTNKEAAEDIAARNNADLSFWGGSWAWNKSSTSYGDKPEDSWFINPTPKLIGEVMQNAPIIHNSCEVGLLNNHKSQLDRERERHLDFIRGAEDNELVSECLDMLKSYQSRFFESVQQYLGRQASFEAQDNNDNADEDQVEAARLRKIEAADSCRGWVARLIALVEAYHECITDERAYNLTYNFEPKPNSSQYGLYRWSVTQALNAIGKRLSRSVKTGKMDADKYRIPRPWLDETQREARKQSNGMIDDFMS